MAWFVPLRSLDRYSNVDLSLAVNEAPRRARLRDAVSDVIAAIHGLPDVLGGSLAQLEVYIGRAGATGAHVRNRWQTRYQAFDASPSAHALVAVRAPTESVREQSWERTAQRVVGSLTQNRALCCANALTGDSGRWPDVDECALYVVSRLRRGPSGGGVDARALNNAVLDLLDDDRLDAQVVRQVSALILDPRRRTDHDRLDPQVRGYEAQSGAEASLPCRAAACNAPAIAGNYGFCRRHRAYLRENETPCKECGRPALTGNYGFCGRHRQTSREDIAQCRVCGRAAIEGNYGFCGYHRRG